MTASTHDPRSADDDVVVGSPRIRWLSAPSLRLHAALVTGVALAAGATWLEWTRAREGHAVAWVYTFEWPLFAVLGVYLWWRLLHADDKQRRASNAAGTAGAADPDLIAWQAYLARLHETDPPGGPPDRS